MYYYVADSFSNPNQENLLKKIKQIIGELDIRGEIAIANPACSAEEYTRIGLEKGYTTIVAIGGDSLVNRLANCLASTPAALGVIPIGLSPFIQNIFKVSNLKSACQALQQRHVDVLDLAQVMPNKFFLSDAFIYAPKPIPVTLEIDNSYQIETKTDNIIISSDLNISFTTAPSSNNHSWWQSLRRQKTSLANQTSLHARSLRIQTTEPISVRVCDYILAKTPVEIKKTPQVLKIIRGYDKLRTIKES